MHRKSLSWPRLSAQSPGNNPWQKAVRFLTPHADARYCQYRSVHDKFYSSRGRHFLYSAFLHPVSDPDLRVNVVGFCRILLQLPADIGHVDPQDLIIRVRVGPPDLLQDKIIGQHLAGISGKQGHQLVLDLGQMDILAFQRNQSLLKVDDKIIAGVCLLLRLVADQLAAVTQRSPIRFI